MILFSPLTLSVYKSIQTPNMKRWKYIHIFFYYYYISKRRTSCSIHSEQAKKILCFISSSANRQAHESESGQVRVRPPWRAALTTYSARPGVCSEATKTTSLHAELFTHCYFRSTAWIYVISCFRWRHNAPEGGWATFTWVNYRGRKSCPRRLALQDVNTGQ